MLNNVNYDIDITKEPPADDTARQYYFIEKAKAYVQRESEELGRPLTFCVTTFGCQMNVNDSRWVARALVRRGFAECPLEKADVVFLNTCSVREKPELKVHSALGRIRQINPRAVVGVGGCVAQQLGEDLMKRHAQVRLVAGSDGIVHVPDAFVRLLEEEGLRLSYLDFTAGYPDRDPCLDEEAGDDVTPVAL